MKIENLLRALRRRMARVLEQCGGEFDFDCPSRLLCCARSTSLVCILLNLLWFFRIYVGQCNLYLRVREEENTIALEFSADKVEWAVSC